jgi:hypothetical protein
LYLSGQKSGKSKTRENTQKRAYLAQNYQLVFKNSACFGGGGKTSENKPKQAESVADAGALYYLSIYVAVSHERSIDALLVHEKITIYLL